MTSIDDLILFLRVADALSISGAARQLDMTPAAVSAAIKRIEKTLRSKLFERTTRVIRLTPQGESFRKTCQHMLEIWANGKLALHQKQAEIEGDIHIAAPTDTTYRLLAKWISVFLEDYPSLNVIFHTSDYFHDVIKDGIDLAIRYGSLDDSSLVARKLTECHRTVIASPSYVARYGEPQSPQDLAHHNCLTLRVRGQKKATWILTHEQSTFPIDVSGQLCGDGSLVRQWALEGRGIAYKAFIDVAEDIQSGRLIQLLPAYTGELIPIHVVLPSSQYVPQRVRLLIDFLSRQFNPHYHSAKNHVT